MNPTATVRRPSLVLIWNNSVASFIQNLWAVHSVGEQAGWNALNKGLWTWDQTQPSPAPDKDSLRNNYAATTTTTTGNPTASLLDLLGSENILYDILYLSLTNRLLFYIFSLLVGHNTWKILFWTVSASMKRILRIFVLFNISNNQQPVVRWNDKNDWVRNHCNSALIALLPCSHSTVHEHKVRLDYPRVPRQCSWSPRRRFGAKLFFPPKLCPEYKEAAGSRLSGDGSLDLHPHTKNILGLTNLQLSNSNWCYIFYTFGTF